eukprot:790326_1
MNNRNKNNSEIKIKMRSSLFLLSLATIITVIFGQTLILIPDSEDAPIPDSVELSPLYVIIRTKNGAFITSNGDDTSLIFKCDYPGDAAVWNMQPYANGYSFQNDQTDCFITALQGSATECSTGTFGSQMIFDLSTPRIYERGYYYWFP